MQMNDSRWVRQYLTHEAAILAVNVLMSSLVLTIAILANCSVCTTHLLGLSQTGIDTQ